METFDQLSCIQLPDCIMLPLSDLYVYEDPHPGPTLSLISVQPAEAVIPSVMAVKFM